MPTVDPARWREVLDVNSGQYYYYHRDTRETTWTKPQDMIEYEIKLAALKAGVVVPPPTVPVVLVPTALETIDSEISSSATTTSIPTLLTTQSSFSGSPSLAKIEFDNSGDATFDDNNPTLKKASVAPTSVENQVRSSIASLSTTGPTDGSKYIIAKDKLTGMPFYYNPETGSSSWILPTREWNEIENFSCNNLNMLERSLSEDTEVINHRESNSSELHIIEDDMADVAPVAPPSSYSKSPWAIRLHLSSGCIYYENTITGLMVWEDPEVINKSLSAASEADVKDQAEDTEKCIDYLTGMTGKKSVVSTITAPEDVAARKNISTWIKNEKLTIPEDVESSILKFPSYLNKMSKDENDRLKSKYSKFCIDCNIPPNLSTDNNGCTIKVMVEFTDTVGKIIQNLLKRVYIPEKDDCHFILKMLGYEDYLIDSSEYLINYQYVRGAIKKCNPEKAKTKSPVAFTLYKLNTAQQEHLIQRIAYEKKNINSEQSATPTLLDYDYQFVPRSEDILAAKLAALSDNYSSHELEKKKTFFYADEVTSENVFRLKVLQCKNVVMPKDKFAIEGLFLTVGFYFNGELLKDWRVKDTFRDVELSTEYPTLDYKYDESYFKGNETKLKRKLIPVCENPRWKPVWLNSCLQLKDLPYGTRITFILKGVNPDGAPVEIAYVSCSLYDHEMRLIQGMHCFSMFNWPYDYKDEHFHWIYPPKPFISGGCISQNRDEGAPLLYIDFGQLLHPVVARQINMQNVKDSLDEQETTDAFDPPEATQNELRTLLRSTVLDKLDFVKHKRKIYTHRNWIADNCKKLPGATLSILLGCFNWANPKEVKEARNIMLKFNEVMTPENALIFLDERFSDPIVRLFAVEHIALFPDQNLAQFMPQLVQSIKNELTTDSPFVRVLLKRALLNPFTIAHPFFWLLRSELHNVHCTNRFTTILELFLRHCGKYRQNLRNQERVNKIFQYITEEAMKIENKPERTERARYLFKKNISNFPLSFELSLSPRFLCRGVIIEECKMMDSKQVPLWAVCENSDSDGEKIPIIFKAGDDLRQDIMTLQLIAIMDSLWSDNDLNLQMIPYGVAGTGLDVGLIEIVKNSDTASNIYQSNGYGVYGGSNSAPIQVWLDAQVKNSNGKITTEEIYTNFVKTCAGYCVATYILGIGDRHPSNIMVTKTGLLFHIDFGHFLGNFKVKKIAGVKFEREKEKLVYSPPMFGAMGNDKTNKKFLDFRQYCIKALNLVRENGHLFVNLFQLMVPAGMPELRQSEDIQYLINVLDFEKSDEDCGRIFMEEVDKALYSTTRQADTVAHILAHR